MFIQRVFQVAKYKYNAKIDKFKKSRKYYSIINIVDVKILKMFGCKICKNLYIHFEFINFNIKIISSELKKSLNLNKYD